MKYQQAAAAVLGGAAALSLLAGCGDGSPEADVVTVTVTPSSAAATTTPPPAEPEAASTPPGSPTSDVVGRSYDFGSPVGVRSEGGTMVLTLDRWTYKGIDDADLAASGVPLTPFTGRPFLNQNAELDYDIPVSPDARILYHHCVAPGEPQQTRSATLEELTRLGEKERLLLVRLDDAGRATAVDNLPGC